MPAGDTSWVKAMNSIGEVFFASSPSGTLYKMDLPGTKYDQICGTLPSGITAIVDLHVSQSDTIFALGTPGYVLLEANLTSGSWIQRTAATGATGFLASHDPEIYLFAATQMYRYNRTTGVWTLTINPLPAQIYSTIQYENSLYAGSATRLYQLTAPGTLTALSAPVGWANALCRNIGIYRNQLFCTFARTVNPSWRVYLWSPHDAELISVYQGQGMAPVLQPSNFLRGSLFALAKPGSGNLQMLNLSYNPEHALFGRSPF